MADNAEHEELTPSTESLLSIQVDENVTAEKPQAADDGKEVKKWVHINFWRINADDDRAAADAVDGSAAGTVTVKMRWKCTRRQQH